MSKITLSDDDGLRCEPIKLQPEAERETTTAEAWCYEDSRGISVYFYNQQIGGIHAIVPLRAIRAYMRHLAKRKGDKK